MKNPKWVPATIDTVTKNDVDMYFGTRRKNDTIPFVTGPLEKLLRILD